MVDSKKGYDAYINDNFCSCNLFDTAASSELVECFSSVNFTKVYKYGCHFLTDSII